MMGRSKLFDNIMQVISAENAVAGTAIISSEIDFELPRGYVAKIHKVVVQFRLWSTVILSGVNDRSFSALLLDPDDALTTKMPDNTVEHDVLLDEVWEVKLLTTTVGRGDLGMRQYDFTIEGLDVITARNMRWNTTAAATGVNGLVPKVNIYYTLEVIKDAQIMELLDIL